MHEMLGGNKNKNLITARARTRYRSQCAANFHCGDRTSTFGVERSPQ